MADEILSFDTVQIMEMITHRYPFLLVDRITECVSGKYAKGYKNLTMNEEFFQGHRQGKLQQGHHPGGILGKAAQDPVPYG